MPKISLSQNQILNPYTISPIGGFHWKDLLNTTQNRQRVIKKITLSIQNSTTDLNPNRIKYKSKYELITPWGCLATILFWKPPMMQWGLPEILTMQRIIADYLLCGATSMIDMIGMLCTEDTALIALHYRYPLQSTLQEIPDDHLSYVNIACSSVA